MPAYTERRRSLGPRERVLAFTAVMLVQAALGAALLYGLRVDLSRPRDAVQRLISIALAKPPPPPRPPTPAEHQTRARSSSSAPRAAPVLVGGPHGPASQKVAPTVSPVIVIKPTAAPSGGGTGSGPATGTGAGGGSGGNGDGDDEGGSDLEQIAGAITPDDYPRHLREAGIGGRVSFLFSVEPNGRVGRCTITRSSGVPELDQLTCRLIQQRFRYRPSTDRNGRPIEDEVDGDHDWVAHSR